MASKSPGLPIWRRIRPAGWVVIVAVLGGGGFFAWTKLVPWVKSRSEVAEVSPSPTPEATPTPSASPTPAPSASPTPTPESSPEPKGSAAQVLDPSLFGGQEPVFPPPSANQRLIAETPAWGKPGDVEHTRQLGSDGEVIRAVGRREVAAGLVSVVALAAHPSAVQSGVRAAWYLGPNDADGVLSSCDPQELRQKKLGAVRLSLAHYNLLRVFAGQPLPEITLFADRDTLKEAIEKSEVTGGDATVPGLPAAGQCRDSNPTANAFVLIHHVESPLTPADLSSMLRGDLKPEAARGFLTGNESHFAQLFDSASKVWSALHLINTTVPASEALDLRFFKASAAPSAPPMSASPAPSSPPAPTASPTPTAPAPKYGYPSTVFDF